MEDLYVWDENGVKYRKVKRKAYGGEKIVITNKDFGSYENGDVFTVTGRYDMRGVTESAVGVDVLEIDTRVRDYEYAVLEPVETEEPTPQLAGIHDSLASLAVEVTKLKSVVSALTGQLTPLQLAILNAENTPADVKLALIVEAGRLESERQAKLDA